MLGWGAPYGVVLSEKKRGTWWQKIYMQGLQGFSLNMLLHIFRAYRCDINWQYIDKFLYLLLTSIPQTIFSMRERHLFSQKIASTELVYEPLFVLGHWRNGTTFLHNLLCQDPNLTYPRTYQSLFPGSFLAARRRKVIERLDRVVSLKTRPMDNVKFSLYEPWEDEFIMAALTGISPYMRVMFPRTLGREAGYRYPDYRSQEEVRQWQDCFTRLLKRLTIIENKRIVLKSPPHTARIRVILELFPKAKFIHIIRHPYDVFPSNIKTWRDGLSRSFFQTVSQDEIIEIIFSTYEQVYERYHAEKADIPESNLVEIKFEDLERDPLEQLNYIYQQLKLPDFEVFSSHVSRYLEGLGTYRKNVFQMSPAMKGVVRERWRQTFEVYGYEA